jgi:hypothetical protein
MDKTQLQWENYKMRQAHVWKSLDRLVFAVVTLWAIPFIKLDLFDYKYIIFLFPTVALLLSYTGRKLLKAEYARLIAVFDKIKENDESLDFMKSTTSSTKVKTIKPKQIGNIMLKEICIGMIVLSLIDLLFIIGKISGIIKHL